MTSGDSSLELVIYDGDGRRVAPLAAGSLSIGRSDDNDIAIADASVSRRHALLHVGERIVIEDLGGANGTRIRRARRDAATDSTLQMSTLSRERAELGPSDCVSIGSVLMVVRRVPSNIGQSDGDDLVASDEAMRALSREVDRIAPSRVSVLLLGETGVGKEVVARALHRRSPRAGKRFIPIHCAAMTPTLFESELFGHERGAFTGATGARPGLLESADGGTVFLDEVGEIPPELQAKLLRVLEDRTVQRIGAREGVALDLRFVAATNRDLEAACSAGAFRQDLFFRLNAVTLVIPSLRERPGDLVPLARRFAEQALADLAHGGAAEISDAVIAALYAHDWPGNVRELRNVIERAVVLADGGPLRLEHLTPRIASLAADSTRRELVAMRAVAQAADHEDAVRGREAAAERERILYALERAGGNQTDAARLLGVSRRTLINRIEQHGLPRPRKKSPSAEG